MISSSAHSSLVSSSRAVHRPALAGEPLGRPRRRTPRSAARNGSVEHGVQSPGETIGPERGDAPRPAEQRAAGEQRLDPVGGQHGRPATIAQKAIQTAGRIRVVPSRARPTISGVGGQQVAAGSPAFQPVGFEQVDRQHPGQQRQGQHRPPSRANRGRRQDQAGWRPEAEAARAGS